MCGFAGYLSGSIVGNTNLVMEMVKNVSNRGPDSDGYWIDHNNNFAVAHKRLSILELSNAGNQPILSFNNRYVLVFNGEIYNHLDIRFIINKKFNYSWSGTSDSETLIQSINFLGLENTVNLLNGMFAFAVWDRDEKELILIRDRLGEKPLFYGLVGESFLFGSELKCFKNFPNWQKKIDKESLELYFRYGYIPSPNCIFENFYKVEPGEIIRVKSDNIKNIKKSKYWNIEEKCFVHKIDNLKTSGINEYEKILDKKLNQSIKQRLISDVPIGAFLSGGLDSSTVVSIMQFNSSNRIKTFTVGFEDKNYDETDKAKKIANFLGTDHNEIIFEDDKTIDLVEKIGSAWDEPFADISQIPTFLVSYIARKDVKVVLSGDGGDEIFCGYNRYLKGLDIHKLLNQNLIRKLLIGKFDKRKFIIRKFFKESNIEKIEKLLISLKANNLVEYYDNVMKIYDYDDFIFNENNLEESFFKKYNVNRFHLTDEEKLMYLDLKQYLPHDILTKVDRASMYHGLEARSPFLDHELVEFAFEIPIKYKKYRGNGKKILKKILSNYIPSNLIKNEKKGFSVPIKNWLIGPLKEWAESMIEEEKKNKESLFNFSRLNEIVSEDNYEFRNYQKLWTILMFLNWKKSFFINS